MTTYTLQDLMYAKGTSEPVRQMLQAQAAEIEGWKADQKENLRNQCDLQAEINRLRSALRKAIDTTYSDSLQAEWIAILENKYD
jgi:hypothetical protein